MSENITADAVVIGAGAIGASSAYHLAAAGHRVTLIEALDGPAAGSTGRSFASIRGQWADDLNIEMSWRSIE
ncbi:MAG: FAD-dependent oxidoreductase, partial [Pseudonocardiales bacterium]